MEARRTSLDYLRVHRAKLLDDLTKRHRPVIVPGRAPIVPGNEEILDLQALWRDLGDDLRARILCAG